MVPLRLISGMGFITSALSVLLMIYYLGQYLTTGIAVAGWTTVVVLITLFSGVVLLSLGVIGEYLVRVLRELQYPQATPIREKRGFEEEEN
jgi:dolichol-phosphate mannosyltransferase/undecaprenyl-phosphate 4-deoxy-4-formamido-L-arabinose transferase